VSEKIPDVENVVRRAYNAAEGNVLDLKGFNDLFTNDGVINMVGYSTYRGDERSQIVAFMGKLAPDVHRELHQIHVIGNLVAVKLSIRGTFSGVFESPAGVIRGNGAKLDVPCADFWYVENGKIKQFDCYMSFSIMHEQMGIPPDFASAVKAQGPEDNP
jgi:ketosteroid isomerase-like protein